MKKPSVPRLIFIALLVLLAGALTYFLRQSGNEHAGEKATSPPKAPAAASTNLPDQSTSPAVAQVPGVPRVPSGPPPDDHFSPEMRKLVASLDRGEPVRLKIGEGAAKTYYTAPRRVTAENFKISQGVKTELPSSFRVYTGYEFLPSGAKGEQISIAVVNDAVAMSLITRTGDYRVEKNAETGKLEAVRLKSIAEPGAGSEEKNCQATANGSHVIKYSAATARQAPVKLDVTFDYDAQAAVDPNLAAVDQSSSTTNSESVNHPYFRLGPQYDASLKDITSLQVMAKATTGVGTASNLSSKAATAMSAAGLSSDILARQLGLRFLLSELIMIASDSAEDDPAPPLDLGTQQATFINWIKTNRPFAVYKQGHSACYCVIPGGVAGLASGIGIYGNSDQSVTIEEHMGDFCVHNHELGHCLGAYHSTGGIMNPSVSSHESFYAQVGTGSPITTAAMYIYNYLSNPNRLSIYGSASLRKADELPFGVGDTVTTALNTPVTFSPLTNDKTSVLGGSVNVISLAEVGQVYPVAAGKAAVSGNNIIFTPATGFMGRAWLTYTLRGSVGNSGLGWLHNADVVVTVGGIASDPTLYPSLNPQNDYVRTDFSTSVRMNPLLNDEAQGRLWAGDVDVLLSATDTTEESYSEKAFTLVGAVVQAGNGSVALETRTMLDNVNSVQKNTGYLVYTPGANEPNEVIIKYTVRDALGNTADAYIALARVGFNYPPIAVPQSITVADNVARAITLAASDGEGATLTYTVVAPPAHGKLSGTPPNLTYSPDADYTGPDSFSFKANDGTQDSNPATVSLTVSPNTPPVAKEMNISTDEDTGKAFVLAATDAENGALTYSVLTQPTHGTLTGTAPNLTYTPALNYFGTDSFTFMANDGYENSIPATVTITVIEVNDAPVAVLSVDHPIAATGATVNFDASASSDVDGTVVAYNIDFGDGQSAATATAAHAYANPGFYTAVATVTDNTLPVGAAGTTTLGVTVVGADTIAADGFETGTTSGGIGWSNSWVLGANATVSNLESPNSGAYHLRLLKTGTAVRTVDMSMRSGAHPVLTFNWKANSFDSSTETAKVEVYDGKWYTVLLVVDGQDTNAYQAATIDLSGYNMVSNFQIRASIQGSAIDDYFYLDNIQINSSQSTNVPPVTGSQSLTTAEDTAKAITLTASDANGDALTYSIVTPPAHGTLSGTAPNLTYTPVANYAGSDSFDYTVTDPLMSVAKGTVTLTITPVNDAPVASGQSVVTSLNTPTLISLSASDVDGDALTYQIVTGVAHGALFLSGRGVTYTPTTDYSGNDSFTFKVNDGQVDSNVATVDISVVNGTALPVTSGLALWLDASQLTAVANGQQVDTWTDMSGLANHAVRQSTSSTGNPSLVTNVINGKPVLRFVSNTSNTGDYLRFPRIGTIRSVFWVVKENAGLTDWHFLLGDQTTYDFHRSASKANGPLWDSTNASAYVRGGVTKLMGTTIDGTTTALPSAQFQLISLVTTGNVQANQITQDRTYHGSWQGDIAEIIVYTSALSATDEAKVGACLTAKYGLTTTYTALNHAPVANSQSLTTALGMANPITLTATDADSDSLTYSVVAQPAHGTLAGTPPAFTYTPDAGFTGNDSFTFKANDGAVDSNIATVGLTVRTNSAPVANAQSITTAEDSSKAVVLGATDADSDPLTYTIVTAPTHGTLTGTAPSLTYAPTANYNGADSFTFKVSDGFASSTAVTVNITVTAINDAPVANALSVATFISTPVQVFLMGTDVEGGALSYSVVTQPAHGALSGTAPNLTYTPAAGFGGTDTFAFKANDGVGDSIAATVTITVGTSVIYSFNAGTGSPSLQGWIITNQNDTGTGPKIMVSSTSERGLLTPPVLTTRSDTEGGIYNGDASHPVLVARSPGFTIGTGALITFESAGGSSVNAVPPALGSGAYNANAMGVSLVSATTGVRVLSVKTANEIAKATYTLDPSAFANDGNSYYLEVVDNYSGSWGYCEWDNFNIQASAALPLISITATDATATEGTPVTDTGTFTVTRSSVTAGATTANLTYNGTATSGIDYTALPSTVTFAAGETTKTITVTPIEDILTEGSETVIASISPSADYIIDTSGTAMVTINDAPTGKIWNGGGADTNWGTAANWGGGVTPNANDVISFAGTVRTTSINNLTADTSFTGLNFINTTAGQAFSLSGNRITLGGDISLATANGTITDSSSIPMILSGNRTVTANANHNLTLSGILSGTGGLTKAGNGTLTLSGNSTFTGDVIINAGTLRVAYVAQTPNPIASGLGNPQVARSIYVNSGTTLAFDVHCPLGDNSSSAIAASLIVNGGTVINPNGWSTTLGPVTLNGGAMTAGGGNMFYGYSYGFSNGNITVGGSAASTLSGNGSTYSTYKLGTTTVTFNVADATSSPAADLIVTAPLIGGAKLTKSGNGTMLLSGNNTYSGVTTVGNGTLQFAKMASLYNGTSGNWTAAKINVKSGATLALNVDSAGTAGFDSTNLNTLLTNISAAGSATSGLQSGAILGLDTSTATGGTFTQGNIIANSSSTNGGAIGLTKLGTGTLVLDKSNTYTGPTSVTAGTLSLSNSCLADAANVALATGAVLNLNFSGTDTVGKLIVGGVEQYQGMWGGLASSGALHKTAAITGTGLLNVTAGPVMLAPTVTTAPTASAITYGQTLASSTLSGGVASVSGTFAFTAPNTVPGVGTTPQSVTFTPSDQANYATLSLTVNVTVNPAGFDGWASGYGLTGAAALAAADPDGDRVPNLIEYALGLSPTAANANPITLSQVVVNGSTYLQLSVNRNPAVTNVLIEGLSAGTLGDPAAWSAGTTVIVTDAASIFTVRDNQPIETTSRRFLKLRFTLQP
ncbi:MAG: Ig-like domain-containing protein [Verrucomicrobiota bacterium]